jgi:hypothetical protein
MSKENLAHFDVADVPAPAFGRGSEAFDGFEAVNNRILYWTLQSLPWLIIGAVLFALTFSDYISSAAATDRAGIVMYSTGMTAAALSLITFQILLRRIPETLRALWSRNIVGHKPESTAGQGQRVEDASETETAERPAPSDSLQVAYQSFVQDVEKLLNHPGQWALGLFFTLLVLTWAATYPAIRSTSVAGAIVYLGLVVQFLIALVIGSMAWRMVVIAVQIWRLGKRFDISPRLGHPDQCGGLEPLGNLCLLNALVVSIAGIFLGGWIIFGPSTPYRALADFYAPLYTKLLLVPLILAIIGFFLPLWSVHQAMVAKRAEVQLQLDQLARTINDLERKLLEQVDELEPDQGEKTVKELKLLKEIYERNQHYPVWPFNTRILIRFATSQSVPILGITGLGESILKIVKSLNDFLSQTRG